MPRVESETIYIFRETEDYRSKVFITYPCPKASTDEPRTTSIAPSGHDGGPDSRCQVGVVDERV